jgi:hypothetical protein
MIKEHECWKAVNAIAGSDLSVIGSILDIELYKVDSVFIFIGNLVIYGIESETIRAVLMPEVNNS